MDWVSIGGQMECLGVFKHDVMLLWILLWILPVISCGIYRGLGARDMS